MPFGPATLGLASILDIFSWLNRDEGLPPTEQVPVRRQLNPRLLPRRVASCREARASSLTRYVAILSCVLVAAAWVSWIVVVGASGHSASCPAAAMVARHDVNITTCKLGTRNPVPCPHAQLQRVVRHQRGHNENEPCRDRRCRAQASRGPSARTPRSALIPTPVCTSRRTRTRRPARMSGTARCSRQAAAYPVAKVLAMLERQILATARPGGLCVSRASRIRASGGSPR